MIRSRLLFSLMFLLIGFVLGSIASFFIFGYNKTSKQNGIEVVNAKKLKEEVKTVDISYQKQVEALQHQNIGLQEQLELSQELLQQAKQDAKEKESQIKQFLPVKPFQDFYKTKSFDDYETALFSDKVRSKSDNCDSMKNAIVGYIDVTHRKDSVYELQLLQFDSLLTGKDAIIETSKNSYNALKALFDQSISGQSTLQKENLSLRAENKRQKFKSKLLTGALLVVSGFAANLLRH